MDIVPQVCHYCSLYETLADTLVTSGYDFGYLVKLLSCVPLPTVEEDFFDLFSLWFPMVYDVKYMMRSCKLRGGLQDVAKALDVRVLQLSSVIVSIHIL